MDAFNSSMPHEEVVMDHGRQRRRAVFDVSDEELLKKKEVAEESEDEVSNWKMGEGEEVESEEESDDCCLEVEVPEVDKRGEVNVDRRGEENVEAKRQRVE